MRKIINLNENWSFFKGDRTTENPEIEEVNLPHTWNSVDGQDGGNDYYRGFATYKKTLPQLEKDKLHYLEINGANSSAFVFLNGNIIGSHNGGYSTWRVNLTPYLNEELENLIEIVVDNAPNDYVYPQIADFTFYGGLYRDVNIVSVEETHFDLDYYGGKGLMITPIIKEKDAEVEIKVFAEAPDCQFKYEVLDGEEVVYSTVSADKKINFTITGVHLWNGIKDPHLYLAKVSIVKGEEILDQASSTFGCRSFKIDAERGFILNGEEYALHGVSRHQDRLGIGNALLPCHHQEDIDLIMEVGANTVRLAHYQHDQYFYDLCDQKGLVVWAEIPYISQHMPTGNDNAVSQMKELIVQNYSHPSIVVWGLSNEITMNGAKDENLIAQHKILNDIVHDMDATRPTVIACISMCGIDEEYVHIPDVVSYNHYFGWYGGDTSMNGPWFDNFHQKYPNTPIGVSEYGCEALNWHTSTPTQGDYTEEYQAYYHEELIKQLFTRKYIWATHVWNMFDFGADARAEGGENGQNHKGLITFDRKYKKDAFYAYKAWLSKEPFVHICGKRYVDRVEDITKITVYSNLSEVELFVNGESVGKKTAPDHFFYFEVKNEGETEIVAKAGEFTDKSAIKKVDKFNQDYILREQGAVLNWFDITEIEGRFSLNDKLGEITKTLRGKLWFFGLLLTLAKKQSGKGDKKKKGKKSKANVDGGVMKMIGSFTVLRFTGMLGMRNVSFTKEELLKMNRKLNRIKKPKNK